MIDGSRIVAIVPARNEAPRIGDVVRGMPPFVDRILVIDDGSTDGTAEAARSAGDERVVVLRHETARGVGAAIATGYGDELARGGGPHDVFVVLAGDGQMDPLDLRAVVGPAARGEVGYVKGNRFAARSPKTPMPWGRRIAGEALSRLTSFATGLAVHDSQCGYTALSREAAQALDLAALWPRYGYPNDLLAQLARRRIGVREVVVEPVYRGGPSGVRPWHVLTVAGLLLRARLAPR